MENREFGRGKTKNLKHRGTEAQRTRRKQKAESRKQKAEGRGQRAEGRGQRAEGRGQGGGRRLIYAEG